MATTPPNPNAVSRALLFLAMPLMLCGGSAVAQVLPPLPLSPRNANYTIEARLDHDQRLLAGRQQIEWRNLQSRPTDELWFHMYWNGFRNDRSTWMIGDGIRNRASIDEIGEDDWGWLELDSMRLIGEVDGDERELPWRYAAPDDGNLDDRTVIVATLPRPIGQDETVRVELSWRAKIPRIIARTGFHGEFYLIAHWFPKLGVYESDGWNCHQFHSATEFFSDFGVYDVTLDLPGHLVVGATGRAVGRSKHEDGRVTHRFRQEDVHGFAWTASPDFIVRERRFDEPGLPPVDMRLLIQPDHLGQVERHFDATAATLRSYGRWYGPYPYGHLTIVDPAWRSDAGGMEYPALFTCGSRRFNPYGGGSPEGVTIHEAGHQFWYGVVANNEFEHAWLDEGLNTYSTLRTRDTALPPQFLVRRHLDGLDGRSIFARPLREIEVSPWQRRIRTLRREPYLDPPAVPTWRQWPSDARVVSYSKTALWLGTLERHLGWKRLQPILSTFYRRYSFGHPTPENFFEVVDELAGEDLSWFFDQVHDDSVRFDYAISSVDSERVELTGWVEGDDGLTFVDDDADSEDDGPYHTQVIVQRRGEGRFPVEVLMVFEDGAQMRRRWDGQDRWRRISIDRASRLEYAVVDPDHVLMLDTRRLNNSRRVERADPLPATKWSSKWMIWLQDTFAALTFYL